MTCECPLCQLPTPSFLSTKLWGAQAREIWFLQPTYSRSLTQALQLGRGVAVLCHAALPPSPSMLGITDLPCQQSPHRVTPSLSPHCSPQQLCLCELLHLDSIYHAYGGVERSALHQFPTFPSSSPRDFRDGSVTARWPSLLHSLSTGSH